MVEHMCLFCGQPLKVDIQTYPAKYGIPDKTIVTCQNPVCTLVQNGQETQTRESHIALYQESQSRLFTMGNNSVTGINLSSEESLS